MCAGTAGLKPAPCWRWPRGLGGDGRQWDRGPKKMDDLPLPEPLFPRDHGLSFPFSFSYAPLPRDVCVDVVSHSRPPGTSLPILHLYASFIFYSVELCVAVVRDAVGDCTASIGSRHKQSSVIACRGEDVFPREEYDKEQRRSFRGGDTREDVGPQSLISVYYTCLWLLPVGLSSLIYRRTFASCNRPLSSQPLPHLSPNPAPLSRVRGGITIRTCVFTTPHPSLFS